MAVLTQDVGRMDILVHRGVTERFGVLWQQSTGGRFNAVDLTGWTVTGQLLSPDGAVWLSKICAGGADGLAVMQIDPADTAGAVWAGRGDGQWRITAVREDRTELLGWGNCALA